MTTGASATPSGSRASHEAAERLHPSGFDPSRLLLDELDRGIVSLTAGLAETEISDTFWYRYWSGYLKGYETLRDKLRTAIAMEARGADLTHCIACNKPLADCVGHSVADLASAIETGTAETEGLGPKDESAPGRPTGGA